MKAWMILIAFGTFISLGCSSPKKEKKVKKENEIGQYVYIDSQNILHTSKDCFGLMTNANNEVGIYKSIEFIDTTEITRKQIKSMCSRCVSDQCYQHLKKIADRNENGSKGWSLKGY